MGFIKEFKVFAMKGNILELAVAIIIGGAFGKIISSLVGDIIMPLVNPLIPGGDWKTIHVGPGIKIGSFFGTVVDFLIIAFVIFMIIKAVNTLKKKEEATAPAEPSEEIKLLTEIRDLLKK